METFHLPLREIEERFTRSELVFVAWRSQELHHNMMKDHPTIAKTKSGKRSKYSMEDKGPQGMPDRFFNKDGEIDLRQVSGEDARMYFAKLGIPLVALPAGTSILKGARTKIGYDQ